MRNENKPYRSAAYQNLFYETVFSDEVLTLFSNEKAFNYNQNQNFLELQDKLLERVLSMVPTILTPKQYRVFQMYFLEKKTTPSIAKELGINVSCVRNQLKGAKNNRGNNGVLPRLKTNLLKDQVCVEILSQMEEMI